MITAKRLVLLLLTGIVMASVACGPSEEEQLHQQKKELIQEQKNILLCGMGGVEVRVATRGHDRRQDITADQPK